MKGKDSLVYKLVLDISRAMKDLDRFKSKAVRTNEDIGSANKRFSRGGLSIGGSTRRFEERIFGPPRGGGMTGPFNLDETSKKFNLLGKISDQLNTSFGLASMKAMTLGGSFNTLATHLLKLNPLIVGSILAFGKIMERTFHYGNIIEQSKMVLTSIWDSEKRAAKAIMGMREFSRITQHSPEEVVGGTTMLAKYGVDPFEKGAFGLAKDKNVMNLMSGLAAMPGMGGLPIGLDRAINAAIAGRDIRPLKALGPEVLAAYEKARGAGISGSSEYIEVMLTELAKIPKIMNLAVAQADTLSTLWSTITGYAEEFFMDFSGAGEEEGVITLWSQMRDILKIIRDEGEKFVIFIGPYLTELGTALGAAFNFIFEVIRRIWSFVGPILTPAFKILLQITRIIFEVFKGVLTTVIQLGKFLYLIISLPFRLLNAILGINSGVDRIVDGLRKIVLGLQISFMFLKIFIDGVLERMEIQMSKMVGWAKRLGIELKLAFSEAFEMLRDYVKDLLGERLYNLLFKDRKFDEKAHIRDVIQRSNPNMTESEIDERLKDVLEGKASPMGSKGGDRSGFTQVSEIDKRVSGRQSDRLENMRMTNYNTTVINNITQQQDIQNLKNVTGQGMYNPWKKGKVVP